MSNKEKPIEDTLDVNDPCQSQWHDMDTVDVITRWQYASSITTIWNKLEKIHLKGKGNKMIKWILYFRRELCRPGSHCEVSLNHCTSGYSYSYLFKSTIFIVCGTYCSIFYLISVDSAHIVQNCSISYINFSGFCTYCSILHIFFNILYNFSGFCTPGTIGKDLACCYQPKCRWNCYCYCYSK